MSAIIQLLPDSVANQIAAGEVVQRPSSVIKELVENSIDAGSTSIQVIIKDAGKKLIQVIDNGCGMLETDARMCFERHATSKIKVADDLFTLQTKGFRGEAMASIAAIAHIELKTKRHEDELGTLINIEGSEIKTQEPINCNSGSSIAVKNLFYNVPARRNFLKSDQVETKHIIEEFIRVALPHPDIHMSLVHNGNEIYNTAQGSLRQRIVGVFGKSKNQQLVPVDQETDILKIYGFIGKPEFAKKTRGEQYFFVNNRFIKNNYLNHAIVRAYNELLANNTYPSYFLFMDVDPKTIDVNIHPTKTEVKFEEEKAMYAILHSSIRQSIGKYNIAPTLDFEQETSFNAPMPDKNRVLSPPQIKVDNTYNPFEEKNPSSSSSKKMVHPFREKQNTDGWEELYKVTEEIDNKQQDIGFEPEQKTSSINEKQQSAKNQPFQLHNKYIVTHIKSGMTMIDQQRAHERVLYEKMIISLANNTPGSQQELFPQTIKLNQSDYELIKDMQEEIRLLGFDINDFGNQSIVINGIPEDAEKLNLVEVFESLIEQFKHNASDLQLKKRDNLARAMAKSLAIRSGQQLSVEEMNSLIDQLFGCEMPYYAPNGKSTIVTFTLDELKKRFEK